MRKVCQIKICFLFKRIYDLIYPYDTFFSNAHICKLFGNLILIMLPQFPYGKKNTTIWMCINLFGWGQLSPPQFFSPLFYIIVTDAYEMICCKGTNNLSIATSTKNKIVALLVNQCLQCLHLGN